MTILFMLIFMWSGIHDKSQITIPSTSDSIYRAAKYSCLIDLTIAQDLAPGMRSSMMSHQYCIQYGENITIQILVPDPEIQYLPVYIQKWDYAHGTVTQECCFNNEMKYYISTDSISISKDESKGMVRNLCDQDDAVLRCDSVMITSYKTNKEYLVYFNDSLANISSGDLFYPDIKYLPSKIVRNNAQKTTRIREEMIYGKPAIDSLIHIFHHVGYERISEEEWNSAALMLPDENKEILARLQQRLKE